MHPILAHRDAAGGGHPHHQWRTKASPLEVNDEWVVARRCMRLETIAKVTDTEIVRLPGVAARSASGLSKDRRACTTPWG